MKTRMILITFLVTISTTMYSQGTDDPSAVAAALVPAEFARNQDENWAQAYADQLSSLLDQKTISSAVLRAAATFCQEAQFPDDPRLAAFLVFNLLTDTDYQMRSSVATAEIMLKMRAAWKKLCDENRDLINSSRKPEREEKDKPDKRKAPKTEGPVQEKKDK